MKEVIKICKIHGNLNIEQIRKDGKKFRCKICRVISNKKTYIKNRDKRIKQALLHRENNREHYKLWAREDRKKYPEKYREYAKTHRGKYGVIRNIREIARSFNISVEYYLQMIKNQDNKCYICKKEEVRKNRSGKIAALCVDHNHSTNKVRKLLCHACNQVIGHSKESIEILKQAILYLEKHNHIK